MPSFLASHAQPPSVDCEARTLPKVLDCVIDGTPLLASTPALEQHFRAHVPRNAVVDLTDGGNGTLGGFAFGHEPNGDATDASAAFIVDVYGATLSRTSDDGTARTTITVDRLPWIDGALDDLVPVDAEEDGTDLADIIYNVSDRPAVRNRLCSAYNIAAAIRRIGKFGRAGPRDSGYGFEKRAG
ncbi:MAG: hypothetical protein AAF762_08390 [Pseudomonadota bacterium]